VTVLSRTLLRFSLPREHSLADLLEVHSYSLDYHFQTFLTGSAHFHALCCLRVASSFDPREIYLLTWHAFSPISMATDDKKGPPSVGILKCPNSSIVDVDVKSIHRIAELKISDLCWCSAMASTEQDSRLYSLKKSKPDPKSA
jgi:hypothetical protein